MVVNIAGKLDRVFCATGATISARVAEPSMSTLTFALDEQNPTTLLLSARTAAGLEQATQALSLWVTDVCKAGNAPCPLPELAAALRDRLQPGAQRRALRVESWADAEAALRNKERWATGAIIDGAAKLVISLPGQGTVRPGVLARLLAGAPGWAEHLLRLGNLAKKLSGFDYVAWLGDAKADPDTVLKDNAKTQLTIFCVGTALARWLVDLGLRPDGYVGHSLGEWMGATLASVLTEEEAILAVHHRGRLMQATGPGAALIVRSTAEALAAKLPPDVALACVNAPNLCLVSGRPDAIARCAEQLSAERIVTRPAPIHVAVHSTVMDAVIEPFERELSAITFREPRTPILSTVTGQWMSPAQATDRGYWAKQLRATVRFDSAAEILLAEPRLVVLEVGVGSALTSLIGTRIKDRANQRTFALFGRDEPPPEGYPASRPFQTLAELWTSGIALDLVGKVQATTAVPSLPSLVEP
jgi:phthiocerol/phenolphthiocerol synthesis type-I polyketide synthase E